VRERCHKRTRNNLHPAWAGISACTRTGDKRVECSTWRAFLVALSFILVLCRHGCSSASSMATTTSKRIMWWSSNRHGVAETGQVLAGNGEDTNASSVAVSSTSFEPCHSQTIQASVLLLTTLAHRENEMRGDNSTELHIITRGSYDAISNVHSWAYLKVT
jgi:hypothetical protein